MASSDFHVGDLQGQIEEINEHIGTLNGKIVNKITFTATTHGTYGTVDVPNSVTTDNAYVICAVNESIADNINIEPATNGNAKTIVLFVRNGYTNELVKNQSITVTVFYINKS